MADGAPVTPTFRTFDPYAIRAEFPILSREVSGRPLVYLDNAASAQKPRAVIEAMTAAMEGSYANVHRGLHTLANETTEAFEGARETAARFLGAAHPEEIVFTKGGTEALNLLAFTLGQSLKSGEEILVSEMEHHSNIVPWRLAAERTGAVLRWIPITDDGDLDMVAFLGMLGPRTRIVSVTQMSNVLGTINPIREICAAVRDAGAVSVIDGCQGAVHGTPDVWSVGCDFYVMTGHKLYGPTGIGVLYGREERLEALPPYQGGGEMIESVSKERITYARPPHRFEAGTPPILEAIGLGAALEWLSQFEPEDILAHETRLFEAAEDELDACAAISVIGHPARRGPILPFHLDFVHAHDVAQVLDQYGVAVRAGLHCAEPLARRMGYVSSIRASFALYNTLEEVTAFAEALTKARKLLSR